MASCPVNSDVLSEVSLSAELPVRCVTHKQLLPTVHPAVLSAPGVLGEAPATLLAGKRPFPSVPTLTLLPSGFTPKGLATLGALEGPLRRVNSLVGDEAALPVVAVLALATLQMQLLTQAHQAHHGRSVCPWPCSCTVEIYGAGSWSGSFSALPSLS